MVLDAEEQIRKLALQIGLLQDQLTHWKDVVVKGRDFIKAAFGDRELQGEGEPMKEQAHKNDEIDLRAMTLPDAIEQVMREHGGTVSVRRLQEVLARRGAEKSISSITSALSRLKSKRWTKVGRGTYSLSQVKQDA
jgi:hypothetical protein